MHAWAYATKFNAEWVVWFGAVPSLVDVRERKVSAGIKSFHIIRPVNLQSSTSLLAQMVTRVVGQLCECDGVVREEICSDGPFLHTDFYGLDINVCVSSQYS